MSTESIQNIMKPLYLPDVFPNLTNVEELIAEMPWKQRTSARQECFFALDTVHPVDYTYGSGSQERTYRSGNVYESPLMCRIWRELQEDFSGYNLCFLNRYDHDRQHLGWHADDSPSQNPNHSILVLSYGEPREIWWKRKEEAGLVPESQRQLLENGSVFLMPPHFQEGHYHRIPKGSRSMGPRVSLTFRQLL